MEMANMRIIETPKRVVILPEAGFVGHYVATVEDEANGKRYAYVEKWRVPWQALSASMAGWAVFDIDPMGNIDFSRVSDALSQVADTVEKAGIKPR